MDFKALKAKLYEFDALREGDEIQEGTIDRIEPEFADAWPKGIHPNLRIELIKYLRRKLPNSDNRKPYRHQAQAIKLALKGHDVVLESPTASGKTLAFAVPLLNTLLLNPNSHALLVYPMNALSLDQSEKIRELAEPLGITVGEYHGGVKDKRKREEIRKTPPRILISSPEYINQPYLGWRKEHWYPNGFLPNLRFLVIDEMHLYHGYFGSNMSLLLRRFFRYLHYQHASPQLFLATATCANPVPHAKDLTGRDVTLVQARDALRPMRHYLFVRPNTTENNSWKELRLRIEKAALAMLEHEKRALIFCPTINFIEEAYKNCIRTAEEQGLNTTKIARYHSRLPSAEEKMQTQEKIKSGEHQVIFTTNALEVGLDIGGLDGIVLAGFPSNVMSAWQRIGRAGRDWQSNALVLFYAMDDPIDIFYVSDIDSFLDKSLDELVVNPSNEHLIHNHLDSLMDETQGDIRPRDKDILGETFYEASRERAKTYRPPRSKYSRAKSPQQSLSDKGLRGDQTGTYDLHFVGEPEPIGRNIPEMWKFRHAYKNAIFTFAGKRFRVYGHVDTRKERKILLEEAPPNHRTEAFFKNYINVDDIFDHRPYPTFTIYLGEVNINITFDRYNIVEDSTDVVLQSNLEPDPEERSFQRKQLHAIWIETDGTGDIVGIFTLLQLLRVGAEKIVPFDRFDISTFPKVLENSTVFLYETYSGGIGNVERLFKLWYKALDKGIERAMNCKNQDCRLGCPICIEPPKTWTSSSTEVNKLAGIALAKEMLSTHYSYESQQ